MKTTKSFADLANQIIKKYPYAKNSKTDNDSMLDELQALADEQEAMKQAQEGAQATAQGGEMMFPDGGYPSGFMQGVHSSIMDEIDLDPSQVDSYADILGSSTGNKIISDEEMGITPLDAVPLTTGERERQATYERIHGSATDQEVTNWDLLKDDFTQNKENYANAASGIAPAVTNYLNLRNVGDAKRVDPIHEKPIIKPTFFNNEPVQNRLQQGMASASYNMSKQGGDFDTYAASLMKMQDKTNIASGMAEVEGQKINMEQQNTYDKILTEANIRNTERENQANVNFHQEEIDKAQLKRDYRAGIADNVSGIFKDIADYGIGKKVGAWTEKWEKIKGIKPNLEN